MKRNLFAVFAVVVAIAGSAFTTVKFGTTATQWYRYTSSTFTAAAEKNPANYVVESFASCDENVNLCRLAINPNATGTSALEEADILLVIDATGPNDIDSNNDHIVDVQRAGVSELKD